MEKDDIRVLQNSRKYLTFQGVWPKSEKDLNGRRFYVKFILITLATTIILWGSLAHLVTALYYKTGAPISFDITIIISITGTYYFNSSYVANVTNLRRAFKDLSNWEICGVPPGITEYNRKLNKYAMWHQIYMCVSIMGFTTTQLFDTGECMKDNARLGIKDVCGLVTNIWTPFDVDYFPVKQIINIVQIFSAYFSFAVSSTISFSILESMEHVIFRMKHVTDVFVEALNGENNNYEIQKATLGRCINYHNFIISVAQNLSESYSLCIFCHVLLTGAILGCCGNEVVQGVHLNTITLLTGWLISLLMVASAGQGLIDECYRFHDVVYSTNWHHLKSDIQKDLILVLMRSDKPTYLKAGAFGFMSYQVVLSILKTSYSIVSLMKGTS